jgi:hypothetical protein
VGKDKVGKSGHWPKQDEVQGEQLSTKCARGLLE